MHTPWMFHGLSASRYILIRSFLPFSRFFASGGRVRVDLATFFRIFLNWIRRIIDIFRVTNAFSKKTWQTARIHFYAVLVNEKRRQTIPKALDNEKIAESASKGYLVGSKFCRLISRSRLLLTFLTVVEYVLTNYSFEKCRLVVRSRVVNK